MFFYNKCLFNYFNLFINKGQQQMQMNHNLLTPTSFLLQRTLITELLPTFG